MAERTSDFERFLYANYPDDYRRATASDVPDDVLTAIISRHERHYKIWTYIPEWIKSEYRDRLPTEVLNGNEPVKDFVENEELKLNEKEKETKELMNYSVSLLALGYAAETVATMVENRSKRQAILQQANGAELSPDLLSQWLETRESDKSAITKDWRENQKEKYIFHLIKQIDRANKRVQNPVSEMDTAAAEMKRAAAERELTGLISGLKGKEAKQKMATYLRQKPQQAALKHLSPEALAKFSDLMQKQGIRIAQARESQEELPMDVGRESLVQSLKKHFNRRQAEERILEEKYRYQNMTFNRVSAKELLSSRHDAGLDKLISLRREAKEQQRA